MSDPPLVPPHPSASATEGPAPRASMFERERTALATHRATLRGSELPPPKAAPGGTLLHGFFLPFSLIASTLRDRALRGPYLRLVLVRGLLVLLVGVVAIATGSISAKGPGHDGPAKVVVHKGKPGAARGKPVHVDAPGLHVDIGGGAADKVSVLGTDIPVTNGSDDGDAHDGFAASVTLGAVTEPKGPPPLVERVGERVRYSWGWLLALLAFLSATEGVIVFFSRRWDDWLSFHASRLAAIRPEDETPKAPAIAFDLKWLYRKMKRRVRGYVVLAAGIPALLPLRLFPTVGPWLFTIAVTLWGWYWLGVFSAAKSAHAWADEGTAPSPLPIRELNERVSRGFFVAPLRLYARIWARLTRGMNPAAATFERSPKAFLGLALARAFLSLPGLYLLARPIVPVAAGRLCAEADPADRFSAAPMETAPQRVPCAAPAPSV